jgi:metal transporter CNNM
MALIGKTVTQLVRPLSKTFMLDEEAELDDRTMRRITLSGFSRIPVHAPGDRSTLLGLLVVKNLIVLNPHVSALAL